MSVIAPILLIMFTLAAAAGCSRSEAATRSEPEAYPTAVRSADGALPRLVFFMNPDGRPCQIQQRVLNDISGELNGKVELVVYRTTSAGDGAKFQQYGIRSLPALVLADASGKEVRRATPGIQNADSIRRLIGR